jgi:hypothetical protein
MLINNVLKENLIRLPVLQLIRFGADSVSILLLFVKLDLIEAFLLYIRAKGA